ncbi:MAG: putative signal peptide protein [Halothiobacillaceae bacterium]|nr:MAG: putative signal peptide protein [Halothiobacillaceae bacterium]
MKKRALLAGLVTLTATPLVMAESYTIDPLHTYPQFTIDHLGFSTMHGRFNSTSGTIDIDLVKKTGSVAVTIDATSIDTGMKKRDDHLRSPEFLNAVEFPQITYKSNKITFTSDTQATVEGDLTIMGTTKPVQLTVHRLKCGQNPMNKKATCGFDATAAIKRSDFGVTYGLPAIGDEMKLTFEVEAVKE